MWPTTKELHNQIITAGTLLFNSAGSSLLFLHYELKDYFSGAACVRHISVAAAPKRENGKFKKKKRKKRIIEIYRLVFMRFLHEFNPWLKKSHWRCKWWTCYAIVSSNSYISVGRKKVRPIGPWSRDQCEHLRCWSSERPLQPPLLLVRLLQNGYNVVLFPFKWPSNQNGRPELIWKKIQKNI